MIKKKGQTIRLDTPNTTMVLRTDTAEYLYYGSRLVSGGDLANIPGSGRRFLSTWRRLCGRLYFFKGARARRQT